MNTNHSPTALQPWANIFSPALAGQRALAISQLDLHLAQTSLGQEGEIRAIGARACRLLGLAGRAHAERQKAEILGGGTAAALCSVVGPAREEWCEARLQDTDPGVRADAACDLVWLRLRAADHAGALEHLGMAQRACPGHGEAARWRRFMADAGRAASRLVQHRPRQPRTRLDTDVYELVPWAEHGWLSHERMMRRLQAGTWTAPAPGGTGLRRLQEQGVCTRLFGLDSDHVQLPADHPLVGCEAAFDEALSLETEGRPTGIAAARCWGLAKGVQDAAHDAAQGLVALGVRDPSAVVPAREAAAWLVAHAPQQILWRAYQLRLAATFGPTRALIREANGILTQDHTPALAWGLTVEALYLIGNADLGWRAIQAGLRRPDRRAIAERLRNRSESASLAPYVSDRLRPRFSSPPQRQPQPVVPAAAQAAAG